ncbi:MAG: hypothetical protein ACRCV0_00870 [Brevinema sp.]
MLIRTLQTSILIGTTNISKNISFSVNHSINSIKKIADISISSKVPMRENLFCIGDPCEIFLTNHITKSSVFKGQITWINQTSYHISISATEVFIPLTTYHETFQDTQLKDICANLGEIEVIGLKKTFRQFVIDGNREQAFIRIIQNLEDLTHKKIYYSTYNDKIIVRETIIHPQGKTIMLSAYSSFYQNTIECFPVADAQVGDTVIVDQKRFVISSISTSERQQTIIVEAL